MYGYSWISLCKNTIRCKKLATIDFGSKNVARPFVRRKQISYISLLLHFGTRAYLFSPDEGSCYIFWPKTIVARFLHFMVLLFKVLLNHSSKRQFLVLHCGKQMMVNLSNIIWILLLAFFIFHINFTSLSNYENTLLLIFQIELGKKWVLKLICFN